MSILKKELLDSLIKTIEGKEAIEREGLPITFRRAFVSCCGIYQPQMAVIPGMSRSPTQLGEEAIRAYDLGLKIHQAESDIELPVSDFELLRKIVTTNRIYAAFITAQLFKILESLSKKEIQNKGREG